MKKGILSVLLLTAGIAACTKQADQKVVAVLKTDSLADESAVHYPLPVSAKNTDMSNMANIKRPDSSSIINSSYAKESIYGIWTYDPNGPHADFDLNEQFFYVVDYDGNGEMPYQIEQDSITVYYNDYTGSGKIKAASNDTLSIHWNGDERPTIYTRWKQ